MKKLLCTIIVFLLVAFLPFVFSYNAYTRTENIGELIVELESKTSGVLESTKYRELPYPLLKMEE